MDQLVGAGPTRIVAAGGVHLSVEHLAKRYVNGVAAVSDVTFSVDQGELVGLLGPSGCGKTTMLRMIGGLTRPSGGRITVAGRDMTHLPSHKRNMGFVFQNYALFPHMTVARNVAFGLRARGVGRAEIANKVGRALEMVRLGHVAERRPRELSGGQQQRVALARALVIEPSVLLLDEALSNLDAKLREEMRIEIRDIQQRLGITTVLVTHDQTEALSMCDRVALMRAGQLEQIGSPYEIYERPLTPFAANFVGRVNTLHGVATADGYVSMGALHLRSDVAWPHRADVTLMVRPHRISIVDSRAEYDPEAMNVCRGRVTRTTYIGDIVHTEVLIEGERLIVEQHTNAMTSTLARDAEVTLQWRRADTMIFPRVRQE